MAVKHSFGSTIVVIDDDGTNYRIGSFSNATISSTAGSVQTLPTKQAVVDAIHVVVKPAEQDGVDG